MSEINVAVVLLAVVMIVAGFAFPEPYFTGIGVGCLSVLMMQAFARWVGWEEAKAQAPKPHEQ